MARISVPTAPLLTRSVDVLSEAPRQQAGRAAGTRDERALFQDAFEMGETDPTALGAWLVMSRACV